MIVRQDITMITITIIIIEIATEEAELVLWNQDFVLWMSTKKFNRFSQGCKIQKDFP